MLPRHNANRSASLQPFYSNKEWGKHACDCGTISHPPGRRAWRQCTGKLKIYMLKRVSSPSKLEDLSWSAVVLHSCEDNSLTVIFIFEMARAQMGMRNWFVWHNLVRFRSRSKMGEWPRRMHRCGCQCSLFKILLGLCAPGTQQDSSPHPIASRYGHCCMTVLIVFVYLGSVSNRMVNFVFLRTVDLVEASWNPPNRTHKVVSHGFIGPDPIAHGSHQLLASAEKCDLICAYTEPRTRGVMSQRPKIHICRTCAEKTFQEVVMTSSRNT